MKKILLLFLITIILSLTTSCNDSKLKKLKHRISELKKINTTLTDSLSDIQYKRITSSYLVGIPEAKNIALGKPNKFKFIFTSVQDLPEYNVYKIIKEKSGDRKKELVYRNLKKSSFKYNFTPKSTADSIFQLEVEFELHNNNSGVIHLPYRLNVDF